MLGTLKNVGTYLGRTKRGLFALAVLMTLLTSIVVADCARETINVGGRTYGGEQYWDFVSCGSSAGNFAYTCDENGRCYENPTIDPADYCSC